MTDKNTEAEKEQTITINVSIPERVWKEWNDDCVQNFGDSRWLKMKFDHEFRHQFGTVAKLLIEDVDSLRYDLLDLEQVVGDLTSQQEQRDRDKKSKKRTMGGDSNE